VISEDVAKKLSPKKYFLRKLDLVAVKGKNRGVWVYEVCGSRKNKHKKNRDPTSYSSQIDVHLENRWTLKSSFNQVPSLDADHAEHHNNKHQQQQEQLEGNNRESYARFSSSKQLKKYIKDYERIIQNYLDKNFEKCLELLEEFLKQYPENMAAINMQKRVKKFVLEPPDNWQGGIYHHEEK
jgi:hypothetical protein